MYNKNDVKWEEGSRIEQKFFGLVRNNSVSQSFKATCLSIEIGYISFNIIFNFTQMIYLYSK